MSTLFGEPEVAWVRKGPDRWVSADGTMHAEWLAMFGTAWSEIARRVGLKEAALERRLYRYGRGDLVFANKPRMEWWS